MTEDRTDYYINAGRKVGDFCLGFFGVLVASAAQAGILGIADRFIGYRFEWMLALFALATPVVFVGLVVYCFVRRRRFIAIGMLATILLPLVVVGACFLLLVGSMR